RGDAEPAQRAHVLDDIRVAAREQRALTVVSLRLNLRSEPLHPISERAIFGLAPGVLGELAQPLDRRAVTPERVLRELLVGAVRIPGVTQARRAAQRRPALAADPHGRTLLHRLRPGHHVPEL